MNDEPQTTSSQVAVMDIKALMAAQNTLPLLTPDLPGSGGVTRSSPDDFEVEEIPLYAASGSGDHLYLWIEKRGFDSRSLWRHLARSLEISERDIGYAGLKDTVAVTRQQVSVPASCEARLAAIDTGNVRVLSSMRNDTKLRTGHLEGNRFRIVVRKVGPAALVCAERIVQRLSQTGVPNYFGPQRFGRAGQTLREGMAVLRGEIRPRRGFMLRLLLSAVQSALFNVNLAERLSRGTLHRIELGEVLQVVASGGPFTSENVDSEQARFERREIVPSGPMFGPKMRLARGAAALREQELLERAGLEMSAFARFGKLLAGTRRALLFWPQDFRVVQNGDDSLELHMTLPAGSYASVVLAEIIKDQCEPGDAAD